MKITPRMLVRLERCKKVTRAGCWEWIGAKAGGYGQIFLPLGKKDGKHRYKALLVHRVAYKVYKGINPGKLLVCHRCDNPSCFNPDHLFLGTNKQNTYDAACKGRLGTQDFRKLLA